MKLQGQTGRSGEAYQALGCYLRNLRNLRIGRNKLSGQ
jgi:hypothetical protein